MVAGTTARTATAAASLEGIGFAVVDVETTGLDPERDRVVELAVILADASGARHDCLHTVVDPGRPMGATAVHGLDDADVAGAPSFDEVAGPVASALAGRVLVAHNLQFDLAFLATELGRSHIAVPELAGVCTMAMSAELGLDLPNRRLPDCARQLGLPTGTEHAALHDAAVTSAVFATYLACARRWGVQLRRCWTGPPEPPGAGWVPPPVGPPRWAPRRTLSDGLDAFPTVADPSVIEALRHQRSPQLDPCPRCGAPMVRRVRRRDGVPFLSCSAFPRCRHATDV